MFGIEKQFLIIIQVILICIHVHSYFTLKSFSIKKIVNFPTLRLHENISVGSCGKSLVLNNNLSFSYSLIGVDYTFSTNKLATFYQNFCWSLKESKWVTGLLLRTSEVRLVDGWVTMILKLPEEIFLGNKANFLHLNSTVAFRTFTQDFI